MTPDTGRLTRIVEREARGLLSYFERRVVVREDAADMLAETLIVLWQRLGDLPADDVTARMWLYGVARKVLLAQRRKARRRLEVAQRLRADFATTGSDDDDDVAVLVRAAVRELPERDRELIGLVHWEGFPLVDAARIMGIRPGAARMRYSRARERLRQALAGEGGGRLAGDHPSARSTAPRA